LLYHYLKSFITSYCISRLFFFGFNGVVLKKMRSDGLCDGGLFFLRRKISGGAIAKPSGLRNKRAELLISKAISNYLLMLILFVNAH